MSTIREQREKADVELGITASFEAAKEARELLASAVAAATVSRLERRKLEMTIEQREADVIQETWASNADMPVTRLDKLVKVEVQQDATLRQLRVKLLEATYEVEKFEAEKTVAEAELRVQCARMNELQGYLQFTVALMDRSKSP